MTSLGRHPNLLIGLLLAVVAVLVIVAVIGLGAPPTPPPNPPIGAVADPAPAVAATPTPTPAPVSVAEDPVAPESPAIFEIAPGVRADCGQIGRAACEQAIALARAGNEGDIVGTTLIVVDDICAPDVMCDRMFPFDSIVVFVTAGGDTTGWYAYHVVGTDAGVPEKAERWQDQIPSHIEARIRAALATP